MLTAERALETTRARAASILVICVRCDNTTSRVDQSGRVIVGQRAYGLGSCFPRVGRVLGSIMWTRRGYLDSNHTFNLTPQNPKQPSIQYGR